MSPALHVVVLRDGASWHPRIGQVYGHLRARGTAIANMSPGAFNNMHQLTDLGSTCSKRERRIKDTDFGE